MTLSPFLDRLQDDSLLFLDGATGTELERRGFSLVAPGWSATAIEESPELLIEIHREYMQAGSNIVTANTFRTHARNLSGTRWSGQARALTERAVTLARSGIQGMAYVAGSVAPLEDCYAPELTPSNVELLTEHRAHVRNLADAGVDLLLIETQITIREALTAATACREIGLPFLVSFTVGRNGALLSGESLEEAARELIPFKPSAVLVNCLPAMEVLGRLQALRAVAEALPLGAYANTGRLLGDGTWEATESVNPAVYAEFAAEWKEFGIKLLGGCCGTSPLHVEHLIKRLCAD